MNTEYMKKNIKKESYIIKILLDTKSYRLYLYYLTDLHYLELAEKESFIFYVRLRNNRGLVAIKKIG